MRLEALTRLIESADFLSFREISLRTLSLKGYKDPSITDGWSDGGTDIRVTQVPPNPTPLAVQITVEKDWRGKLKTDSLKVKQKLHLLDLIYITSRRVPEGEFHTIADEIWRDNSVRVSKIDSQAIASIFFERGKTTEILQILGIEVKSTRPAKEEIVNTTRLDAAYSFIFFGRESEHFREKMIESTLITAIAKNSGEILRTKLVEESLSILQLPQQRSGLVSGAIDRMVQRGDLILSHGGNIKGSTRIEDASLAIQSVKEKEWDSLRTKVEATLKEKSGLKEISPLIIDSVMEGLGSLLLSTADAAFQSLERGALRSVAQEKITTRLRHLHTTLDSITFPEGEDRKEILETLYSGPGKLDSRMW